MYPKGRISIGDADLMIKANEYRDRLLAYFKGALVDKEDAEDLVQHTIIRAGKYINPERDDFEKKLFLLAKQVLYWYFTNLNHDIMHPLNVIELRENEVENDKRDESDKLTYFDSHASEYDNIEYEVILMRIREKLPNFLKRILDMTLDGYNCVEIAKIIGTDPTVVRAMKSDLFRRIRGQLKKMGFVVNEEKRRKRRQK